MSYSIVRVSKVKSNTNTTGIQKHVQRENNNYENEDIDHSKTHLNYDLVNEHKQNFNNLIDKKIEQNYTGKRKIRTDAVKHVDGLITSDSDFFDKQSLEDTKQFFEHAKAFLEQEYGKDNLLYATVHMDEKTPHMHYGVVPITEDGRMSAKEVVGNKKALTEFQDRFNEYINQQGYDLERGQSRQVTNAKHEQINRYKQKTEYHKQEYERESQNSDHIKQQNDKLMQEYQKSLETLKKPLNVSYEKEVEKVGSFFNKEIRETGNVVISQEDFNAFQKQIEAAQSITDDYEYIKSGNKLNEMEKEYKRIRDTFLKTYQMYQDFEQENIELKEGNKEIKDDLDETNKLLYHCKIAISKLLEEISRMFERRDFVDKIRGLGKDNDQVMNVMRIIDKENNPQYYQEQKQEEQQEQKSEQKRNRGMTR